MNRPFSRIFFGALLAVAAGCSGGGSTLQPVAPVVNASPSPLVSASPVSSATPPHSGTPAPSAAPANSPTPVPTASPTTGAATLGRVYVTNSNGSGSVTVYQPAATGTQNLAPVAMIAGANTGLDIPTGVALDAAGNVYVVNQYAATVGSITVYPPNPSGTLDEAPLATISGNLTGLSYPSAIAVDASGYIYVTNGGGAPSVTVYPPNPSGAVNESPYETIIGSATGISAPIGVAIDSAGLIYVANDNNTSGQNGAQNAATTGSITVYAARTAGTQNAAPVASIVGTATGFNFPRGIALDSSDRIFTTNDYGSILAFPASPAAADNEAPFATISGTNTLLEAYGLALDASGRIYTANEGGTGDPDTVTVYAANPSGTLDETPVATITGTLTNLSRPTAVYVR